MPALFAGGACFDAVAGFEAGALLLVALAGAVELASAGVEAGALAEEADFFERLFLGAAAPSLVEAPADDADWSAEAFFDFLDDFLAGAEASAVAVLSAASAFFEDFFFEDPLPESSL